MAEKKETKSTEDMFEFYTGAYKTWLDVFNSWTKVRNSFPTGFKGVDTESWFKPMWGYTGDWSKVFEGFPDMFKTMPLPLQSMKETSEAMAKGIDSYVKVYNAWLKGTDKIAREGYELSKKLNVGEEMDTGKFLEAIKSANDDITAGALAALKDTPFSGMNELNEALKKSLDSFPEDQKMARDFFQELFSFNIKAMNLSTSAMKEATKSFADMLEKGQISSDGYKSMIDAYGETLKHSIEILQLPTAVLPGYKDIADDTTNYAKANLDLSVSWLEMNLKLYQGITKSSSETYKTAEEVLKDKKMSNPDEFYRAWMETNQKSMDTMVKNAQFYQSVPKFINSYISWLNATNKLSHSVMTPPTVTKEDIDRINEELAKVKASMEKKATPKPKAGAASRAL